MVLYYCDIIEMFNHKGYKITTKKGIVCMVSDKCMYRVVVVEMSNLLTYSRFMQVPSFSLERLILKEEVLFIGENRLFVLIY